jgi:hypothetical protein
MITFALLFFFAVAIPSANAQLAPRQADQTVAMQPGDKVTVTCRSSLQLSRTSTKQWIVTCKQTTSATPVAPTATGSPLPGPTQTIAAPTATRASGGASAPYASAPLCSTHDATKWHGLWDSARGCHYDHEHGDDPSLADSYFGPAGAQWGGQAISYPFATSDMENTHKHGGYKYSVKMPNYHPWPACGVNSDVDNSATGNNCIVASRIEYHIVGGTMDTLARVHSYYMEAYVCKYPAYTDCGIIRIGGHADFAELKAPHYSTRIVRPGGMVDFGNGLMMDYAPDGPDLPATSGEPYVFMIPFSDSELAERLAHPPTTPNATMDQWSMQDLNDCEPKPAGDPCHNKFARFLAQVGDAWNLLDTQNPNNLRWICKGQPGCQYNGSLKGVNEIGFLVLQAWQSSGNGFVTMQGFTDRWGNPRTDGACTSASVDCVPLSLEHAPVGYAGSRMDNGCECVVYEYDTYFNNQPSNWIQFPN